MKVGLVLGGGAARGITHIGVLKVLRRHQIPIDLMAATSVGAMLGAFYAAGLTPEVMERGALRLGWRRLLQWNLPLRGAFSSEKIQKFVVRNIGNKSFAELKIPLTIVATDLLSGDEVLLQSGPVAEAVAASASIPGFYTPWQMGDQQLVDGLVVNNVPVNVVRSMGADFIIAVDAVPQVKLTEPLHDVLHVMTRALDIVVIRQAAYFKSQADVVIEPVTRNISAFALNEAAALIEMGERATESIMPQIKKKLSRG